MGSDRGSATAELAVVLPAVVALLALLLFGANTVIVQIQLEDGARIGARAMARGEAPGNMATLVRQRVGRDVQVDVGMQHGLATVTVSGKASVPFAGIVPWTLSATAAASVEGTENPGVP